jgi:CubicO group peptidase (beta-lactamase class C family)
MRLATLLITLFALTVHGLAADKEEQRVDRLFAAYDKPGSPGCALGVIRNGDFVYRKGYGMASLELGVPLSSQSVFYMGSVSKQFTAAAVVLAAEQGFLSLDDNVRKYIPEIPDYGQPITLRQMLHHTSGFRDVLGLLALSGRSAADLHPTAELLDLVARQKALNFIPGEKSLYSNTNYFLLAEVVKRSTGKPLSQFAAENIFRPLGMAHTRFYDDHNVVVPGRIPAYEPGADGGFLVDWSTNFEKVGDGGLMSTVDDLLLWDRNFYENKLGKGTLIREMETRGVLNNGKQIGYALGLELGTYRGLPIVEHDGGLFGYRTDILRFPDQRFTVVCLCNLASANPAGRAHKVADIYLEKSLQPTADLRQASSASASPVPAASASSPAAFAGKYYDSGRHSLFSFTVVDGNLTVLGITLRPVTANRFEGTTGYEIEFAGSGSSTRVTVNNDGMEMLSAPRIDDLHLDDAALAAYTGAYRSVELDATYKLSVEKGKLMLRTGWDSPEPLTPIVSDEFDVGGFMTLVFRRDASRHISGLNVFSGRVRDIGFDKVN